MCESDKVIYDKKKTEGIGCKGIVHVSLSPLFTLKNVEFLVIKLLD